MSVLSFEIILAVWTGLEPATPCVTGMYSNQLNYQTRIIFNTFQNVWRALSPLSAVSTGLEPATPCVTGLYSNQLNYQTSTLLSRWCANVRLVCGTTNFFIKKISLQHPLSSSLHSPQIAVHR